MENINRWWYHEYPDPEPPIGASDPRAIKQWEETNKILQNEWQWRGKNYVYK